MFQSEFVHAYLSYYYNTMYKESKFNKVSIAQIIPRKQVFATCLAY